MFPGFRQRGDEVEGARTVDDGVGVAGGVVDEALGGVLEVVWGGGEEVEPDLPDLGRDVGEAVG